MSRENEFWRSNSKYHELAIEYESDIELESPNRLSGRSPRGTSFCNCGYCATRITYPTYTGSRV